MTVAITNSQVSVMRPTGGTDSHGWAVSTPLSPVGTECVAIQPDIPQRSRTYNIQGGVDGEGGPHNAHFAPKGKAYLAEDTMVEAGDVLVNDFYGNWTVVTKVFVGDPTAQPKCSPGDGFGIGCWLADLEVYA